MYKIIYVSWLHPGSNFDTASTKTHLSHWRIVYFCFQPLLRSSWHTWCNGGGEEETHTTTMNRPQQIRPKPRDRKTWKTRGLRRVEPSEPVMVARKSRRSSETRRLMNRSLQTRAVFFELRRALGGAFSAG